MTEQHREPVQTLLDLVFYAPIGAFFHGPAMVSDLAARGRTQVANARVIGGVAMERGRSEFAEAAGTVQTHLGDLLVAAARAAGAPMAGAEEAEPSDDAVDHEPDDPHPSPESNGAPEADSAKLRVVAGADSPVAADLPIPGYDNLSASQVVPRLDDLADHELDAVRDYETSNRGRMTILSRIAQLQAS